MFMILYVNLSENKNQVVLQECIKKKFFARMASLAMANDAIGGQYL